MACGDAGYNPGVIPNGIGLFRSPGKTPDCMSLNGETEVCIVKHWSLFLGPFLFELCAVLDLSLAQGMSNEEWIPEFGDLRLGL